MRLLISALMLISLAAPARAARDAPDNSLRLAWTLEWGAVLLSAEGPERMEGSFQASHATGFELSYERRAFLDVTREGYHGIDVGIGHVWGAYEAELMGVDGVSKERHPFQAITIPLVYKLGAYSYAPFFISRGATPPGRLAPKDSFDAINAYISGGVITSIYTQGGGPEGWSFSPALSFGIEATLGAFSLRFFEMTWLYRVHSSPPHDKLKDNFPEKMTRFGGGWEF